LDPRQLETAKFGVVSAILTLGDSDATSHRSHWSQNMIHVHFTLIAHVYDTVSWPFSPLSISHLRKDTGHV